MKTPPDMNCNHAGTTRVITITDFGHGESTTTIEAYCTLCLKRSPEIIQHGFPATTKNIRKAQKSLLTTRTENEQLL